MKVSRYRKGDIVGVCGSALFEFRITSWRKASKAYVGRCLRSYVPEVKVGSLASFEPSQIVVKLGEKGKKWPAPTYGIPKKEA